MAETVAVTESQGWLPSMHTMAPMRNALRDALGTLREEAMAPEMKNSRRHGS